MHPPYCPQSHQTLWEIIANHLRSATRDDITDAPIHLNRTPHGQNRFGQQIQSSVETDSYLSS